MKQSPLLNDYPEAEFDAAAINGMRIAWNTRAAVSKENQLADVSAAPKFIVAGAAAAAWLTTRQVDVPENLLDARVSNDTTVVRLHHQQYLVSAAPGVDPDPVIDDLEPGRHDDVLILPYECAEFACVGSYVEPMLAELCAMYVSQSPTPTWTPTRFAHAEAVVRRFTDPVHTRFVCSPADARFIFGVVRDVLLEHDGALVGYAQFADWKNPSS